MGYAAQFLSEVKIITKHDGSEHCEGWEIAHDKPMTHGSRKQKAHMVVRGAGHWPDDAIEVQTLNVCKLICRARVPPLRCNTSMVEYDGSGKASGINFFVDGERVQTEVLKDHLAGNIHSTSPLEVGDKALGTSFEGAMDELRTYNRVLTDKEVENLAIHLPARSLLMSLDGRPTTNFPPLSPKERR